MMFEADGALWLRTSDFGDDKDRVVVKSDGKPAYISRRPGVLPGQARTRVRPVPHHAGRRPPRLRRAADGDVRRVR
ncbi:MAG: hypothetical protein WKF83_03050 [Nocardioidaceae bacterium]